MPRMHRFALFSASMLAAIALCSPQSSASLLRPSADRAYPDIAGNINGTISYTYDETSATGVFALKNTPYLMAAGSTQNLEYLVSPNADTGVRSQELRMTLDSSGNLVTSAQNTYELYGTVVAKDQTYSGLLLRGTPTAFGSQDLGSIGVQGADIFDVNLDITGGALAPFFGSDTYMRITPELQSTFVGRFDQNFSAVKATSNTRSYFAPQPFPIPEPTTLALLVLGGGGIAASRRLRPTRRGRRNP